MCLTPIYVKSRAGPIVPAPCGKCAQCLSIFREGWLIRLKEHSKLYDEKIFVTLTYDDEHLPMHGDWYNMDDGSQFRGSVNRRDCQLFFKRLRKDCRDKRISYYLVGEYGSRTMRPHYHAIIFGLGANDYEKIKRAWQVGNIHVGSVNDRSINYICKYHLLRGKNPVGSESSFSLSSKLLGMNYVKNMKNWHTEYPSDRAFYYLNGYKKNLPRYYRDKIYSDEDRKEIAIKIACMHHVKNTDEADKESEVNYFKDKALKIEHINSTFKRKSEEGGSL
nr:MAG: replication initiator protein [Microviridae sp.]